MRYARWYDKDEDLRNLMLLLEHLPLNLQVEIAHDIVQVIIELNPENADEYLNKLSENIPKSYKRWYDKDFSVHGAIELIRTLGEEERSRLIANLSGSLVQILAMVKRAGK